MAVGGRGQCPVGATSSCGGRPQVRTSGLVENVSQLFLTSLPIWKFWLPISGFSEVGAAVFH